MPGDVQAGARSDRSTRARLGRRDENPGALCVQVSSCVYAPFSHVAAVIGLWTSILSCCPAAVPIFSRTRGARLQNWALARYMLMRGGRDERKRLCTGFGPA